MRLVEINERFINYMQTVREGLVRCHRGRRICWLE